MSHSIYAADGMAHVKIVAVSLVCAALVAAVGIFAHVSEADPGLARVVKAGRATTVGGSLKIIR